MKGILLTCLIGVIAGAIDVLPMIILNTELFGMPWWLKGGVIGFALALPVIIIVAGQDKNSVPPMVVMSAVLGTLIGIAGHYIIL